MAAVLYMAGFDAKDCLLALHGAFQYEFPATAAAALVRAGYPAEEVGQGLKAVFYLREDEIARAFHQSNCAARDVIDAIEGAYALSTRLAAEIACRAGYEETEVRESLRVSRGRPRRAKSWYRKAVDLGRTIHGSWQRRRGSLRTLFSRKPSAVKIYVYDVPEDLLYLRRESLVSPYFESLEDPPKGPPLRFDLSTRMLRKHYFSEASTRDWTQQYGYEFVLYEEIKNSGQLLTRDPDQADFFLIPHFTTTIFAKLLKNVEFLGFQSKSFCEEHWPKILGIASLYMKSILAHIRGEHPYFDRHQGRDHLLIATWDNGIGIAEPRAPGDYSVTHMLDDATIRQLRNVVQITYHGNRSLRYFRTNPCLIIPPYLNDHLVKRIRSDPRARDFSRRRRTILSFSLGSAAHHPMREVYDRHYRHDPDMLTNAPILKSDSFDDVRLSSLFSICLEGFTPWTMRLAQAFLFGCIPVIVSDNIILPFEGIIDWDECSVRVSPREISGLKDRLAGMPDHEIARLQRGLVKYAGYIVSDSDRPLFEQDLGRAVLSELDGLKRRRDGQGTGARRKQSLVSAPFAWVSRIAS